MRIYLSRAMTEKGSGYRPCELCEADFEPRSIIMGIGPHGFEICGECARALLGRGERGGVRADWPTLEQYEQALRDYPEPMMTDEELRRAEELDLYDDFWELSVLH